MVKLPLIGEVWGGLTSAVKAGSYQQEAPPEMLYYSDRDCDWLLWHSAKERRRPFFFYIDSSFEPPARMLDLPGTAGVRLVQASSAELRRAVKSGCQMVPLIRLAPPRCLLDDLQRRQLDRSAVLSGPGSLAK